MPSSSMRSLYRTALLAISLCIGIPAHAQVTASPPSVDSFFENSNFGAAVLSPTPSTSRCVPARPDAATSWS